MKMLTVKDTATKLAISTQTLYALVKRGELRVLRVGKGRNFRIAEEEIQDYKKRNTQPLSIETILASQVELSYEEFCKIYEKPTGGGKSTSAGKSKKGGFLMSEKKSFRRKNFGFGRIIPRKNKSNGTWRWDIEYKGLATRGKAKGKYGWIHEVVPEAMNEKMATEALLKAIKRQHDLKISPEKVAQQDRENITFKQIAGKYVEQYARLEKRRPQNDEYILNAHLIPAFGKLTLDADYDDAIASYKAKRLADNGRKEPIKRQTINYELAIGRAIFYWAKGQKKYGIVENPFSGKLFKCGRNKRTKTLTDEEEKRLMLQLPEHTRLIANCSLLTCMRRSEVTELRWNQVEIENRRIKLEVEENKSKRVRFIPLCSEMVEEFLRLKSLNGSQPNDYIFTYNGKQVKDIKVSFYKACERAEIEGLHFHDLRRTAATRLLKRGANIVAIQKILGHARIETTMGYLSVGEEDAADAIELLNRSNGRKPQIIRKTQKNYTQDKGFYPIGSQELRC